VGTLQILRTRVFASDVVHPGAVLVAGIITDRLQSCTSQITDEANQLRRNRVVVFGVAITSGQVDTGCLRQVVTRDQLIESRSYNELNNYVNQAVQYACVAPFSESLRPVRITRRWRITDEFTRSHPETVGDMSHVTLNFDLSKIPLVLF